MLLPFKDCLKFIKKCKKKKVDIQWHIISSNYQLPLEFIIKHEDDLEWDYMTRQQNFSEDILRVFQNKISWSQLDPNRYSKEFLREFQDKFKFKQWVLKDEFRYEFGDPETYDEFFYRIKARKWLDEWEKEIKR